MLFKLFLVLGGLTLSLLGYLYMNGSNYRVNFSSSMPFGIYKIVPSTHFEKGNLVSVCLNQETSALALERQYLKPGMCLNGTQALFKQVAGLDGDRFQITDEGIIVNDQLINNTKPKKEDSNNRKMPRIHSLSSTNIPSGFALVVANYSPNSFDSRYFGLVSTVWLNKVEPVLTF